jgi:endonuclease/exonuclease/phosphatase family metal-dependent hydrolase
MGAKLPQLVALVLHADPDLIALQEAGSLTADHLRGLPYRSWHSTPTRGGGLVTLVSHRLLHRERAVQVLLLTEQALVITLPLTNHANLSVANVHLPPSLGGPTRRAVCIDTAAHVHAAPPGARIILGDLNDTLYSGSSWLRAAVARGGCWAGWSCPYTERLSTNTVLTRRGVSHTQLDWVLLSPDTVCYAAAAAVLPGLSTHAAVQVDLSLSALALRPHDPCGRRLRYTLAPPARLHHAAHLFALVAWWGVAAHLSADDIIRLGHNRLGL